MTTSCTTEICNRVIELMKDGLTQEEVAADIGYSTKTLQNWRKPGHDQYVPEFAEAFETAKMHQFCWWVKKGRMSLENKGFQSALYGLFMANMFQWRGASSNKDDDVMEEIRKIRQELGLD